MNSVFKKGKILALAAVAAMFMMSIALPAHAEEGNASDQTPVTEVTETADSETAGNSDAEVTEETKTAEVQGTEVQAPAADDSKVTDAAEPTDTDDSGRNADAAEPADDEDTDDGDDGDIEVVIPVDGFLWRVAWIDNNNAAGKRPTTDAISDGGYISLVDADGNPVDFDIWGVDYDEASQTYTALIVYVAPDSMLSEDGTTQISFPKLIVDYQKFLAAGYKQGNKIESGYGKDDYWDEIDDDLKYGCELVYVGTKNQTGSAKTIPANRTNGSSARLTAANASSVPDTGDSSEAGLFAVIALAAGASLFAVRKAKKVSK